MNDDTSPKAERGTLSRSDDYANTWRHVLEPGADWRHTLTTSYWREMLFKLNPGDRIDVCTNDFKVQFQIAVLEVVESAQYIKLLARPLFPHNLALPPITDVVEQPRYIVQPQGDSLFRVIDSENGMVMDRNMSRSAANEQARIRNEVLEREQDENNDELPIELADALEMAGRPAG